MKSILCSLAFLLLVVGCSSARRSEFLPAGLYTTDRDSVLWTNTPVQTLDMAPCGVLSLRAVGPSESTWLIDAGLMQDSVFITHAQPGVVPKDQLHNIHMYPSTTVKLCYRESNLYLCIEDQVTSITTWYRVERRKNEMELIKPGNISSDW